MTGFDAVRAAVIVDLTSWAVGRAEVVGPPRSCSLPSFPNAFPDEGFEGATCRLRTSGFSVSVTAYRFHASRHEVVGVHEGVAFRKVSFLEIFAVRLSVRLFASGAVR